MSRRSLYVATLAALVLIPVGAGTVTAAETLSEPTVSTAATSTFKSSVTQRAKQLVRTAAATEITVVSAPRTTATTSAASYSDRVLTLTNTQRTTRGLRALAFSSCADGFANSWASALARAGTLSHQALSPILTSCHARRVGENVAYGNVTPEALVQMWMDSAGHRANILNPGFTHLGVGDVMTSGGRVYGVQVFLGL